MFNRSSSQANKIIHLNITYVAKYSQNAKIMEITLPGTQNKFIGESYCAFTGVGIQDINCTVYSQTATTIRIAYINGGTVVLKNLINLYPSDEKMTIKLLT